MGLMSLYEIVRIIRKSFLRVLAISIAVAILAYVVVNSMQTYTCVLAFKFNHPEAETGLAPDGESKLDPYEIQNPLIIEGALKSISSNSKDVPDFKGTRQNISVSKVVAELDKEVSESAALLGEKYEVNATEYEMKFTYKAKYGDEFGPRMFSAIIKEYDDYLLKKYYNRKTIADFAKIVKDSSADYIDISDTMAEEIDDIVEYIDGLAQAYPDYRSKNTGYSFAEISALYQNIRNIQHAKYYGNVRAGNLAKDAEMVVKSYQTKVKELTETQTVNSLVADNYKTSITTFYDPYKAAGLYHQAEKVQTQTDSSNNRDQDVLYDFDIEEHKNTYDNIILNYVDFASKTTDAQHTIEHYNSIINAFSNDTVDEATKKRLLKENEEIMAEILALSDNYAKIANSSTRELYDVKVTEDLQYLIAPEIVADKPVKLITIFVFVMIFGGLIVLLIFIEFIKRFVKKQESDEDKTKDDTSEVKIFVDTSKLDELQSALYLQYCNGFSEFFLVYQEMINNNFEDEPHMESYIRWRNAELGLVPPGNIIEAACELGIFHELNKWIIKTVCSDLVKLTKETERVPVIHINCPSDQIKDFALSDIIIKCIREHKISAKNICFELDGDDISERLEDIMLLKEIGVLVCIDHFENSLENKEIISVVHPELVKMSLDILNNDMYATSKEDYMNAAMEMISYLSEIVEQCHIQGIKVCICGIETKTQESTIASLGFDYKQGYYYSKPKELDI